MASGLSPDVRVFADPDALSRAAARHLSALIAAKAAAGTDFSLALAGGTTPRALYSRLGTDYRERIPWTRVRVFWGDERCVPPDDPRSNYRMARETLLDHVPVPAGRVHPMPIALGDPEEAARAYEREMRAYFAGEWPRFDLVLLGLGADGHTASLFPGAPALDELTRWVVASQAPVDPVLRLTVTYPVLNRAANVCFLVAGADKAEALRRVLRESPDPHVCPAAGVRPGNGSVVWWIDAGAASLLDSPAG